MTKPAPSLNPRVPLIREVIRRLAPLLSSKGVKVVMRGLSASCSYGADGKPHTITLPELPDDCPNDLLDAVQGFLDHECAHALFSTFADLKRAKQSKVAYIANALEDTFIEREMAKLYPGTFLNLRNTQQFWLDKMMNEAFKKAQAAGTGYFGVLFVIACRAWAGQQPCIDYMEGKWPLIKEYADLIDPALIAQIPNLASSAEVTDLAIAMKKCLENPVKTKVKSDPDAEQDDTPSDNIDNIHNLEAEDPPPPPPSEQPPEEQSNDSEGEGEPQESDKGEGEPNEDESEGKSDTASDDAGETGEGEPDTGEQDGNDDAGERSDDSAPADADESGDEEPGSADAGDDADKSDPGEEDAGDPADPTDGEGDDAGDPTEGDDASEGDAGADVPDDGDQAGEDNAAGDTPDDDADAGEPGDASDEGEAGEGDDASPADTSDGESADEGDAPAGADGEPDVSGDAAGEGADADAPEEDPRGADEDAGGEADDDGAGEGEADAGNPGDPLPSQDKINEAIAELAKDESFDGDMARALTTAAVDAAKESDYIVFSREKDRIEPCRADYNKDAVLRMSKTVDTMAHAMQAQLERLVAARSQSYWAGGKRSGRLNTSALHRLKVGRDDVFRNKVVSNSKETALTLLADLSGSMGRTSRTGVSRVRTAMYSAYAFSMLLERLRVKNEVLGFSTGGHDDVRWMHTVVEEGRKVGVEFSRYEWLDIPIFKSFDEPLGPEQTNAMAAAAEGHIGMCNNIDGESVDVALQRLAQRREARKVLIVLSDGQPNWNGDDSAGRRHLKAVIEKGMKAGVDILGIGIQSDAVADYYPKSIVIQDVVELPERLMAKLHEILL